MSPRLPTLKIRTTLLFLLIHEKAKQIWPIQTLHLLTSSTNSIEIKKEWYCSKLKMAIYKFPFLYFGRFIDKYFSPSITHQEILVINPFEQFYSWSWLHTKKTIICLCHNQCKWDSEQTELYYSKRKLFLYRWVWLDTIFFP